MAKILIVEDDSKIARFVELELRHEGYETETATDGRTGLAKALEPQTDLVLLDIMLPELSGMEVCRRIRQESSVPVIMLTAKGDVTDKVAGLDMGANDYMTKPFAIEELLARIRVALKSRSGEQKKNDGLLSHGKLTVDPAARQVSFDGEPLSLTKKEFDLLAFLLKNKNRAVPREELLSAVWDYDYAGDTNVVDVYVRYLRQKVEEPLGLRFIETVRGVGYMVRDEN
ncbi:MAG: response regulator transcription factor [Lachnospiraceae bacterium]|nr:response regulator transcription factor [Lachnospiraceae bacterium]MBQ8549590.1 response regulator transcription factor [Lachnospiraceae bacterium]MBQ8846053.1 response regulator transcription factor [Lachnospiraceae bacterium]